jgi:N-acetylmuramoyl-L-alanine amidase
MGRRSRRRGRGSRTRARACRSGTATLALAVLCGSCAAPHRPGPDTLYARHPERVQLDTTPLRGHRILIDPGHGGEFGGSQGVGATREADVNLGVGLYLWGLLHDAGADVHLTRASDRDFLPSGSTLLRDDLAARVACIDSLRPEVFLSLHHNSNAGLDRERNAVETYYRLEDDGPSFDLARDIHRRLAQNLGIQEARLLPGNYYVLRHAPTAAVLGEASYLSNPQVESRLELAEKQRLEAEAYFLGLLDYFRKGAPRITRQATGDTLHAGDVVRWEVSGGGATIDPLAVELRVDGERRRSRYDAGRSEVVLAADADLAAGRREIELRVRNTNGNSGIWRDTLAVIAPPARALAVQEPDPAAPGSDVRVRIRLLDRWNRDVADGLPVRIEMRGAALLQREATTRSGELVLLARLDAQRRAQIVLRADTLAARFELRGRPRAPATRLVRCLDGANRTPVAGCRVRCGGGDLCTDRIGCALVDPGCDSLRIERAGYIPWCDRIPAAALVELTPVHGGRLQEVVFVLDPAGDVRDPSAAETGISGAQIAHDVARLLTACLEGGGAETHLSRGPTEQVPDLERTRLASRVHADWYVRIDLVPKSSAAVLHYPGSASGEQLARALARWLERRLGGPVQVLEDTHTILQQTPCPAVIVRLPLPGPDLTWWGYALPEALRHTAYALSVGIRAGIVPGVESLPALAVTGASAAPGLLALLDGAESVPAGKDGRIVFECVEPGEHWLSLHGAGTVRERRIQVAAEDTTRVSLP